MFGILKVMSMYAVVEIKLATVNLLCSILDNL